MKKNGRSRIGTGNVAKNKFKTGSNNTAVSNPAHSPTSSSNALTETATTEITNAPLQQHADPAAVHQHTQGQLTTANNQNPNNSLEVVVPRQQTPPTAPIQNNKNMPPQHFDFPMPPPPSSTTSFNAALTPFPKNQSKPLACITIAALAVGAAAFTAGFIYLGLPLAMALAGIALLITLGMGYGAYRLFNYCRNNKSETAQSTKHIKK